jgi:arylsulfatase A-like enzyme
MKNLNIFYLHTHDSGRYWSPYGYSLPTPNIMEFAKDSLTFRHCYCTAPTCSPSRAGLLTGLYPHENGMLGLAHRGFQLNDYSEHLVHHLKEQGLHTVLCGIQHVAPDYRMIEYDEVVGSQEISMGSTEKSMEAWDIDNTSQLCTYLKGHSQQTNLFVSMGWFNTHREFPKATPSFSQDFLAPPLPLYDCEQNRRDMADYHQSVKTVDDCFGTLVETLKETGMYDNSIIILTTDHGIAFPKMKCTLYDTGIGVACILHYPGNRQRGKATDALVSQVDIVPTLCELMEIPLPRRSSGVSWKPLLDGKTSQVRTEIFAEVNYHAAYEPKRCIRTERYKLIRYFDAYDGPVLANIDESPSKEFLMDHGLREQIHSNEFLFDVYLDPLERENRINEEPYQEIRKTLEQKLSLWMQETKDPLLTYGSRIPKPMNAMVNKRSCENPRIEDFEE